MPHVVLQTHTPLYEIVSGLSPFVEKEGETVWRLKDLWLELDETRALAECIVVVRGRLTRFFVDLSQRERDAAIVTRLFRVPEVEASPSIKRMIALVAEALVEAHPDVEIDHSTIRDFLTERYVYRPDPEPSGFDPLLPGRGLPHPLDWAAIFGDENPVEIEIGSGKGTFLIESAERRPEGNFLSIEWARSYADYVRDRVRRRDLRNVRVVRADATRFLADHVPPGSVSVIHIYFPDPWPKDRHHKRRLIQPDFVATAVEALAPAGEIRFVTDHAEYFDAARGRFEESAALERAPVLEEEMTDLTNYERKYRAEGREIHRARYRKVAS